METMMLATFYFFVMADVNSSQPKKDQYTDLGHGISQVNYPDNFNYEYNNYYNQMAELVKGTKYESLFNSNPFHSYDYEPSFIDRLGNGLGFRTNEDKYREEMQNASRNYIAQIIQTIREEQYNSAQENVAREQAAGLNPDLLQNVSGGNATEFDNSSVPPESSSDVDKFGQGLKYSIDTLLKSFDVASSITEKVFSMKSMRNQLDNQEINNLGALMGIADKISDSVNRGDYSPNVKFNIDNGHISWYDDASQNLDLPSYLKYIPLSKRNSERLFPLISQRYHSFENRKKSGLTKKDLNDVLREVGIQEASRYYNGIDDMPDVWKNSLSSISSILDDEFQSRLESLRNENRFNRDYFSGLSAQDMFEAENWINKGRKQSAEMSKNMYEKQAELIGNLVKSSRNGGLEGFFSSVALYALPFLNNFTGFSSGSFTGKNGSGRNFSIKFK